MRLILFPPPSPNIIDGENDYIYHDVDDEYTPRSPPEVIQAPSPEPRAVREDEGEGEREGGDEDEDEGESEEEGEGEADDEGEGEGEGEGEDERADEDEFWVVCIWNVCIVVCKQLFLF